MRRLLSLFPLLIALLWLAAGTSLEDALFSQGAERGNPDSVELRSRVKGAKLHTPACKLTRPAVPAAPVLASRVETFACAAVVPVTRTPPPVRPPLRSATFVVPVPSRTGQVVILV